MKQKILFAACLAVSSAFAQPVNNYDFKYKAEGTVAVLPMQVFDDGKQTIFHFKRNQRIPAIFAEQNGEWVLMEAQSPGAYIYIPTIAARYKLKLGNNEASVHYFGTGRANGEVDIPINHITQRSYAAVAKGDDYQWIANKEHVEQSVIFVKNKERVTSKSASNFSKLALKLREATSIEVIAYNDPEFETGLAQRRMDAIINSLTAYGIERSKIKKSMTRTGASEVSGGEVGARIEYVVGGLVKPQTIAVKTVRTHTADVSKSNETSVANVVAMNKQLFRIEPSDKTILDVIQRWARDDNWEVIPVEFPYIPLEQNEATPIAYGTYLDAIAKMEQGLVAKGYKNLRSKAYTNNILEIGALDEQR